MRSRKTKGTSRGSKRTRTVAKPKRPSAQAKRSAPKKAPKAPAKSPAQAKAQTKTPPKPATKKTFPEKFPFWARLKISKDRTTLVIDEKDVINKKTKKLESGFVHRESTHTKKKDYEEINPNPDKSDPNPMYLKRPEELPKRLFKPHNKELDMPEHLQKRYEKNNKK